MCGIYGQLGGNSNKIDLLRKFNILRGPDYHSEYVSKNIIIGHSRLAIVGTGENGNQPLISKSGKYLISFNGEIYNYKELKDKYIPDVELVKLYSDTEVLIELIDRYGVDFTLNQLDGPFAFALYNLNDSSLILARDFFGEKPLHYIFTNNEIIFSSAQLPLLNINDFNYYHAVNFIKLGYELPGYEIFHNVKSVPRNSYLRFTKINNFYNLKIVEQNYSSNYKNIYDTFDIGLKRRLSADVDVGLCLSDGVDSNYTMVKACELGYKPICFTLTNDITSQSYNNIYKNCKRFGLDLVPVEYKPNFDLINTYYNESTKLLGDPGGPVISYLCNKIRSYGIKTALTGDGSDELFGGYDRYKYINIINLLNKISFLSPIISFNRIRNALSSDNNFSFIANLCRDEKININYKLNGKNPLEMMYNYDLEISLPNYILMKSDTNSMSNGVELRSAFLNKDLFSHNRKIKSSLLLNNGKYYLKKYLIENKVNFLKYKSGFYFETSNLTDIFINSANSRMANRDCNQELRNFSESISYNYYCGNIQKSSVASILAILNNIFDNVEN